MKTTILAILFLFPLTFFSQITVDSTWSYYTPECQCLGSMEVFATGGIAPMTIAMTNGTGSETFTPVNDSTWLVESICGGNWDIEVTDALANTGILNAFMWNAPPLFVSIQSSTDVTCTGMCDGSATIDIVGGQPPYSIGWNNGNISPSITNLCPGTYNCNVTEAHGCWQSVNVVIQEPTPVTFNNIVTQPSCVPGCDGSIDASNATGGLPPFVYSIDGGITFQGGAVFSNLCAGSYGIMFQDGNGCTTSITESIGTNITTTFSTTDVDCGQNDGTIITTPNGGTPPYNYNWTGPNGYVSSTANPTSLESGTYTLTITDINGCSNTSSVTINNVVGSGITATIAGQDANCGDGSAVLNITQGISPISVLWSNGDTNVITNNLNAGSYNATITDAIGCSGIYSISIIDLGGTNCGTINGNVFADLNSNCVFDGSDTNMDSRIVTANPGNYIATTDINGNYEFNIPFNTYTINRVATSGYTMVCDSLGVSVTTDLGTPIVNNISFGDSMNLLPDANVSLYGLNVRSQMGTHHVISLNNFTTIPIDGELKFLPDNNISFVNAIPFPNNFSGDTLIWNVSPFSNNANYLQFTIYGQTASVPLGTPITQCAWFESLQSEITVSNNSYCFYQNVTGSYDPNDKSVYPEGNIRTKDSTLEYLVRFQNTGTDTAFTVVITDTISSFLDLSSLEVLGSTHPMTHQITNSNVLEFTFSNILLPDSNVNEQASHGSVMYSIKQNSSNVVGDTIENTANIYFDFNAPVITNTTISPIVPKQFSAIVNGVDVSCFGDCNGNATITPEGDEPPFLILWDDPNGSITAAVDSLCFGTYTARVIDAEGDTLFQSVNILEPNAITLSSSTIDDINNNCQGQATVTPSGGSGSYTYQWDVAAGYQTTATATGLCGAAYNVTVTDSQGCSSIETVTVLNSLGIDDNQFSAYVAPNPFNNEFTLKLNGEFESLVIINILGEVIRNIQTTENESLIDLSSQMNGIYFIQIQNKGEVLKTLKVVKN